MNIAHRDDIPILLNERGLTGLGVEVGVWGGGYSRMLLERSKLRRLFSVDPWAQEIRGGPDDYSISLMFEALNTLASFGLRSVILRMDSLDAASIFREEILDFVYIDAKHDYTSVTADIRAWYPRIKPGGIIAGHDWEWELECRDVREAVWNFFSPIGLDIFVTESDGIEMGKKRHSWLVVKPSSLGPC